MKDADKMHRVICGHQWARLDEWVDCFRDLANLNDDEIHQLYGHSTQRQKNARPGHRQRRSR